MKELEIQFDLPRSRAEVFNFVSDVRHLDLMTPPWLRFAVRQVSGAPGLGSLRPGTTIDYRLRWRHLPARRAAFGPPDRPPRLTAF